MKRRSPPRFQPHLEALEERCTPSAMSSLDAHDTHGAWWPASTHALVAASPAAQLQLPATETSGHPGGPQAGHTAWQSAPHVIPFKVNGGGTAPQGLPVFPGGTAPHNATGRATLLGNYTSEGVFQLLQFTSPTTGTFQSAAPCVFTAANGDKLAFQYGRTDAGAKSPGTFTLYPAGDGKVIAVFVAEFTPDPAASTGRFTEVTGGSFTMVATSQPFVPTPNAQGFTAPFAYTWVGEGQLEISEGK
jgi:hypothetical protein